MARGRKSTKIKVLTYRDKKLLCQLGKTGITNTQQAEKYCTLNSERIKKLEKSGYIKTSIYTVRGQANTIIQLDKLGKNYCREEESIFYLAKAQTNHLSHDLKLTEIYYNLDVEVQKTWKSENELLKELYDNNPGLKLETCIDATVKINDETIAIESLGDSYTSKDITKKINIAKKYFGCKTMKRA